MDETGRCFTIGMVPVAQPRARATSRGGRAAMYSPSTIKSASGVRRPHPIVEFKHAVREEARPLFGDGPLLGPLYVHVEAVFPRPKSLQTKKLAQAPLWHQKKPDRDNLDKAVLDALTGIAWVDDCQVCDGGQRKRYTHYGELPHVRVTIRELDGQGPI